MSIQSVQIDNVRSLSSDGEAPAIPRFEGNDVAATKAKLSSVGGLEVGDQAFAMDQTIRMVVECRVVGVDHKVNNDGKLERVHHLKAIDSIVIDWSADLDALREGLA